ncbi:acyl-CoA dehydrogenase family protein [Marinobacter sp. OP 3.4]|uniref:acyl-CoA dehydrogenase family protein n=1 Tax=Marinobacter sp. OP 3.4 TaxID=3076501 RepID=UPI002E1E3CC3
MNDDTGTSGLALTEDESQLQASVERFVSREYTFEHYRRTVREHQSMDREFWRQVADLGLIGACFPEDWQGYAQSGKEPFLILEQFGHGLVVEPLVSGVLAPGAVLAASGERERFADVFAGLMSGEQLLALAWTEPGQRFDSSPVTVRASKTGAGWRLNGRKSTVLAAPMAETLLVSAATEDGPSVFLVPKDTAGIESVVYQTLDGQRAADIRFNEVDVGRESLVGNAGDGLAMVQAGLDQAAALTCAEAVGAMSAALELTVDYTQTRKQFGQAIASFQAIQHRLANMAIELEYSRAMLQLLSSGMDRLPQGERGTFISGIRSKILGCARYLVSEAVQLHGGIGVTDEAAISHYFRKVTALDLAWGDARQHLERYRSTRSADYDLVAALY